MSWMDSWSRPNKSQATPAPYYLIQGGGESTPYCRSCGRVISSRRTTTTTTTGGGSNSKGSQQEARYCSARCRGRKPRGLDLKIESVFVSMLMGQQDGGFEGAAAKAAARGKGKKTKSGSSSKKKTVKGDPRILVSCDEVETAVFGDRGDPEKTFGRKGNRASRAIVPEKASSDEAKETGNDRGAAVSSPPLSGDCDSGVVIEEKEEEEEEGEGKGYYDEEATSSIDGDVLARMAVRSGSRIRPPQALSQVNGSVGGEKGRAERTRENEEMARRRAEGQRRAAQREMVRCAARRGVVFGFAVESDGDGDDGGVDTQILGEEGRGSRQQNNKKSKRRKCEAVMQGRVVEPSFAKGNWGIRWRD
ncbi:hypothetical protein F4778DRAFT_248948 [Xylariomycetidae sp. FL2044]|nr:hypothetical protein F4778DRAFT_248948 [Xylariomycetidae sp. FL2044]